MNTAVTDNWFPIAQRRRSGADIHARSGDDTRGSERGMASSASRRPAS